MDAEKSENGKRQIPIRGYFSDDCRVYQIIIDSAEFCGKCRLAEDVAIKLMANNLAYQVSASDFEGIKSLLGKKYTQITAGEYKDLVLQLNL